MITVNGESIIGVEGMTLQTYLESAGYCLYRIAVERNGEILSRDRYAEIIIKDGDILEVVQFVGGG